MGKINITIRIDKTIVKEAKELGLNISKTCENCLKRAIKQIRQLYSENSLTHTSKDNPKANVWWAGPDLNRGPSACQADVLTKLDDRPLKCFDNVIA